MKAVCPKCGELQRYEVTQNIRRTVVFNKNNDRVGVSKEEIEHNGEPYCVNCGNTVVFFDDIVEKREDGLHSVVRCRQCKYFHEAHYEEPGESPYIKYQCKNKYGMPKYTVRPDEDYCSRAERKQEEETDCTDGTTTNRREQQETDNTVSLKPCRCGTDSYPISPCGLFSDTPAWRIFCPTCGATTGINTGYGAAVIEWNKMQSEKSDSLTLPISLDTAKKYFQEKAYQRCGIDVDALSEQELRAALKRLLGMAADYGNMKYITACKDVIGK